MVALSQNLSLGVLLGLAACTADPKVAEGGFDTEAGGDGSPATQAAEASSSGAEAEDESGGEQDRLDVPPSDALGCQKIDFLFVIDNSSSMEDEQQRLIDGFPGFMQGVQETIEAFDHHVMVVGTGVRDNPTSFDPCDNLLGAGRVEAFDGSDCGLLTDVINGQRYVDEVHEDLDAAFACIADVGTDGDGDEKTIWAMADSVTDQVQPGMCNDGFLRDDAILVVTLITDEEDSPHDAPPHGDTDDNSPGDPGVWRDGLVAAKGGDDNALVMLALVGDSDLEDGVCEPYDLQKEGVGAEPALRIRELVESLPYGSWTSVCADNYSDFFNEAVADIDNACTDFTPPG